MHILVTDVLTCPRCGPGFGLILLATRMQERRVLDGELGCSNCRQRYPIRGGFADLTAPGGTRAGSEEDASQSPSVGDKETGVRLAALLGLDEPRGMALLAGGLACFAPAVAAAGGDVETIAVDPGLALWSEAAGVSRIGAEAGLPLANRSLRAVAVSGDVDLSEAARVVRPLGRLVVEGASPDVVRRLPELGLSVLAAEDGSVVAVRKGPS